MGSVQPSRRTKARLSSAALLSLTLLGAGSASAQVAQAPPAPTRLVGLVGLVHDSLGQGAIPGAVLTQLDAQGGVLARDLSNAQGRYAIVLRAGAQRVRIQRIGFSPRTITTAHLRQHTDIALARLPRFLEPTRVVAKACSKRPDDGIAAALLDQARAGLLTAVVSREQAAAEMVVISFERDLNAEGTYDTQRVRIDSSRARTESFTTGPTGADLVEHGFLESHGNKAVLHGPDADVLLDDAFVRAYCFRLAKSRPGRATQVGLGFAPAERQRDRVDIEGTLWVDTLARELRDIEFHYVGLHPQLQEFDPGGRIAFASMANGMVLIDRWSLRLAGATLDTIRNPRLPLRARPTVRTQFHVSQNGGELAAARWADGHAYDAALGTLRVEALDSSGAPATGLMLRLEGTDYWAVSDPNGMATMTRLLPGPYNLIAEDPQLVPIGLVLQTGVRFHANRDSVHRASFTAPTATTYMRDRCGPPRLLGKAVVPRILGRVIRSDGGLVEAGEIHVAREVRRGEWEPIDQFFYVGSDGMFWICPKSLLKNTEVRVQYRVEKRLVGEIQVPLRSDVVIVPVLVDP